MRLWTTWYTLSTGGVGCSHTPWQDFGIGYSNVTLCIKLRGKTWFQYKMFSLKGLSCWDPWDWWCPVPYSWIRGCLLCSHSPLHVMCSADGCFIIPIDFYQKVTTHAWPHVDLALVRIAYVVLLPVGHLCHIWCQWLPAVAKFQLPTSSDSHALACCSFAAAGKPQCRNHCPMV